ncbi:MAG: ABC transporter permease [Acidobacteria bacterium]|nr:ABC transporter permease [Acidobacteriota bacterium]
MPGRPPSRTDRLFRALLRVFPFDFRADYGREMEQTFRDQRHEVRQEGSMAALARLWFETTRDVFTMAPREHLAIFQQDVGYALRTLRRTPVFAAAAILTLAIGVSAVVAVFTIVNAFMLRPLPVDRPAELMSLSTRDRHAAVPHGLSFADLQDYRSEGAVFTDLLGYAPRPAVLDAGRGVERVTLGMVTDNYFSLLGVQPALGRLIHPEEGRARGDVPVLVLAHDYWRSQFGGDPEVVGRSARLNGRQFTIIGVTPLSFKGTDALIRVSGYVPLWMIDDLMYTSGTSILERRDAHQLTVLGRLKPGVSLAQARAALQITSADLARQHPSTNKDVTLLVVPETHARPNPGIGPFFRVIAIGMAALAILLLLITSANVVNLLLARAAGRGREIALRSAGARRGRLARQLVTESLALALMGSAVAVPVVVLAMRGLEQFFAQMTSIANFRPDLSLDLRVLGATLGVAIVSGIVSGLAPALYAVRADVNALLKTGGRGTPGESRGGLRGALVVAQVALSLTLLVIGGLFARSLARADDIDLGFQPEGVLLASTDPGMQGYDPAQRLAFYRNVRDRVVALPGVELAAWISWPPFAIVYDTTNLYPEDQLPVADGETPQAFTAQISPEYFAAARVPLVEGRAFDDRDDADGAPVAIVNQTLARQFWPGRTAIGRRLRIESDTLDVVGVVRDGKYNFVWEAPSGMVFRPLAQDIPSAATIAIRTTRPPSDMSSVVRDTIRRVQPDVATYDVRTMRDYLDSGNAFAIFRLGALVTGLFGGLGVLLASIGLYGMIAYHVSQRTQEFGVRMALGAGAADIIRAVLMRGGCVALIGVVMGVLLAGGLAQLLRTFLLDVSPFDPLTYAAVAVLLILISLLASFVPARRATTVDPLAALRAD